MWNILVLYHTIPSFNEPSREVFENIIGEGENAGINQNYFWKGGKHFGKKEKMLV